MTGAAVDRVHFLDEQQRNRRRSLRFSVFAVVAVGLAGIPLCVLASPLLFGIVLVGAHIFDLIAPLSDAQWEADTRVGVRAPERVGKDSRTSGRCAVGHPRDALRRARRPVHAACLAVYPAAVAERRGGDDAAPARGPGTRARRCCRSSSLANIVQEMAVAAGVRPPAVRIIESPAVNACRHRPDHQRCGAPGNDRISDRLDRDERQAIVAHLVGSVGNGDLEIAAIILSVFQTWGLVALLLETPLDARRRALMRRFVGLSIQAARGRVDAEDARALLDRLLGGGEFGVELEEFFANLDTIYPKSVAHGCYIILVQIPLIATVGLASIAAKQSIGLFTNLVLGPWLAAMWRARRRLADATAVRAQPRPRCTGASGNNAGRV